MPSAKSRARPANGDVLVVSKLRSVHIYVANHDEKPPTSSSNFSRCWELHRRHLPRRRAPLKVDFYLDQARLRLRRSADLIVSLRLDGGTKNDGGRASDFLDLTAGARDKNAFPRLSRFDIAQKC